MPTIKAGLLRALLPAVKSDREGAGKMHWRGLTLACVLGLALAGRYGRSVLVRAQEEHDAVIVLAGGVDAGGRPHEAVMRRLRRAAKLYSASRERGHTLAVVANGGGTTHKPKWVSPAGYAVPEAALMARELERDGVALCQQQPKARDGRPASVAREAGGPTG